VTGATLEAARWSEDAGAWTFRAPQGWIELNTWDDDYEFVDSRFEALPGKNRFTLELTRSCGVEIRLFDGDTALPWPKGLDSHLAGLDHEGRERTTAWRDDHVRRGASAPGRYRIVFGEVSGYLPVEDEEVEIPPETFVEHPIRLRRKP